MQRYLQVFTNRRVGIVLLMGFASGLPLPLVTGTLDAWMASEKVSLTTIGFFSLVGLPYTVKFLWSPLLDRFSLPFLGRRTGWMLLTQLALIVGIAFMGTLDPHAHLWHLAALALVVAFFSASQDIVIDAYRAEVLRQEEMGAGAAVAVLGGRLALLFGGAVALVLSDRLPWSQVYWIMAGAMSVGIVATLLAPPASDRTVAPKSLKDAVVQPFLSFFHRPGAWAMLAFIVFFKLGDAVAGKMTTPFLIQIGFSKTDIGTVNKGFGMIVTIVGALFGGGLIAKLGIWRALWIFGILQALSNFVFVALAEVGPSYWLMVACIGVENVCGGMGTAAFVAFLMSLCDREFSATQYALLSSVMAITRTLVGPLAGYLPEKLGWSPFFVITAILAVPGLALLTRFRHLVPMETPRVSNAELD
jgi:PAT family beta-lactamase induction signal transducer AmpG